MAKRQELASPPEGPPEGGHRPDGSSSTAREHEMALQPHIALVRLQAEAALLARLNAGYGFADARIPAEVYLRDDAARERMARDSLRPRDTHLAQAVEIAGAIADARRAPGARCSPLDVLGDRFALDPAERALLAVAVAYELDADVRDLCHTLAWRRTPALFGDVCQELCPELAANRDVLRVLHPGGKLRQYRLLSVHGELGRARDIKIACAITLDRRVLDWLLGDTRVAEPLHTVIALLGVDHALAVHVADAVVADVGRVARDLEARLLAGARRSGDAGADPLPVVLVQGPLGAGKRALAKRLAHELGRPLASISLRDALVAAASVGDPGLFEQALGEARMRDAVVYLTDVDALRQTPGGDPMVARLARDAIERYIGVVVLATAERGMPSLPISRPFHLIRIPPADLATRQAAWNLGLATLADAPGAGVDAADGSLADELASRYVIGPGTVGDVVSDVRAFAAATGAAITRESIEQAVGRRLSLRLGSFGTLITRKARMSEMVLPEDVVETISDLIAMVRERTQILERWGYGAHLGLSRGVSALFSGDPGTGKTMAASVIAGVLGLELIRIDLSAVTSKWVGETEKHLAKIFDEAQTANAMLLFDEADSLFGKRTELKSAQDRYANLEVNYVLQRMENFDGVSILTTNFESAIDPAFLRRLNFRVRFPAPEEDERDELWRRLLPPDTGIAEAVDFRKLAERFDMTGGHIRNAIVRAAVIAARQGRDMQPEDLLAGAHHEYAEMGKVMPSLMG